MSRRQQTYVLDANVFIQAHRRYYAFDLCPGFWDCMTHYCGEACVMSIDRVRDEILNGDELASWVENVPPEVFASTRTGEIVQVFGQMMQWVNGQDQFKPTAKEEFARVADGWLAAYAQVHGAVVVTQEVYNSEIKKKVPLPNVCREFDVRWVNTFEMLRDLDVRFRWAA